MLSSSLLKFLRYFETKAVMKNMILMLIFFSIALSTYAQQASVEKSIFGFQLGAIGAWVYNESRLDNHIALRTELGFQVNQAASVLQVYAYTASPSITSEPRWYYNLNKRQAKSKAIKGNIGNFFSLRNTYSPYFVTLLDDRFGHTHSTVSITPTWGIRRNLGTNFTYEAGIGLGWLMIMSDINPNTDKKHQLEPYVNLRLGYSF